MPLGDAIDLLSATSTLPITVDPDALLAAGVSPGDRVSVHLADATVGQILDKLLSSRKLSFIAEAGRVLVTMPAEYRDASSRGELHRLRSDRRRRQGDGGVGGPDRNSSPPTPGGPTAAAARSNSTARTGHRRCNPFAVHDQIVAFCEKLRTARDQPKPAQPRRWRTLRLDHPLPPGRRPCWGEVSANFTPPPPWPRSSAI